MAVDVTATASIDRPRDQVAAYLRDPANDTKWIGGIRSARLLTPGPVTVGSQVERVASFLGRRVQYVNEITELTADRLAMRSVRSPFPMRVTYGHRDAGDQHHRSLGAGPRRRRPLLRPGGPTARPGRTPLHHPGPAQPQAGPGATAGPIAIDGQPDPPRSTPVTAARRRGR